MKNIKAKIQGILMNSSQKSVIGWSVEEYDFEAVAEEIVKDCFTNGVFYLSELKLLKDVYLEREEKAYQVRDYRQSHEDSIRRGVIEHIISMQNKK